MTAQDALRRNLPERIFAEASPRSLGGESLLEAGKVTVDNVVAYFSEEQVITEAAQRLGEAGFEVLHLAPTTINIAGPAELYEDVFGSRLVAEERPTRKSTDAETTATYIDTPTGAPGLISTANSRFADVLEGVALSEKVYPYADAFPPPVGYWHLDVPADVSLGVNADRAHRSGTTGLGVRVVMCDSGWEAHPYFAARGYRFSPTVAGPGVPDPLVDENGHGTGESANVFAVAPDVDFTMIKMDFANPTGSFNAAVALSPHVISCSWGWHVPNPPLTAIQSALAAAISAAVLNGIVVVFSAGNGGLGFPGQHPDVISAGGVFLNRDGTLRATRYASGFASTVFPGRQVPDLSGLVGDLPRAISIILPVPDSCELDLDHAGGTHPDGDETQPGDGWAGFSGTSAAAPQIAGAAALIRQASPGLSPAQIRTVLRDTARDCTAGTNAQGAAAGPGYDLATGAGLLDAQKAVLAAKLTVISPPIVVGPIVPPVRPPILPPILPPVRPPILPPILPPIVVGPPIRPPGPGPVVNPPPLAAGTAAEPEQGVPLTPQDVEELRRMLLEGDGGSGDD